jgi:hypothetical protein
LSRRVNSERLFCGQQVLFLIFLVALLIRVVFAFTLKDGFYFSDEFDYTVIACYFVEHDTLPESFDRSPFFSLVCSNWVAKVFLHPYCRWGFVGHLPDGYLYERDTLASNSTNEPDNLGGAMPFGRA